MTIELSTASSQLVLPAIDEKRKPGSSGRSLSFFRLRAPGQSNQDGGQIFRMYLIISSGNPFHANALTLQKAELAYRN